MSPWRQESASSRRQNPLLAKERTYQAKYKFYEPPIIDTLCTTPVHNFSYIDNTAYIISLFLHFFW
jgi:hypothetical protein